MCREIIIRILELLRENARRSITDIAKYLNLSRSMVFRRIKLINITCIRKYTTLADFKKLGYSIRVAIFLDSKSKKTSNFLANSQNVNSIMLLSGNSNLYVEAFFKNLAKFNEFDEKLSRLCKKKREYFIVDEIKMEAFINAEDYRDNSRNQV